MSERDFILDCLDFLEGRDTDGAARAKAEHDRLRKQVSEAKRRALVGADPLNLTGHSKPSKTKPATAAPPVIQIGMITRVVSSMERLRGRNKLNRQQAQAGEHYRSAFELVHSSLGGAMDFDRVRAGTGSHAIADAVVSAGQTLTAARSLLGRQNSLVVEQIVCHGRTVEECARLLYGYRDGEKVAARDANFVGRQLRESLTQLGQLWFPEVKLRRASVYRPPESRPVTAETGVVDIHIGARTRG